MKSKALKRFYLVIWGVLLVVSLLLLIENIIYIGRETSIGASTKSIKESLKADKETSRIHSDIPIMNYASDEVAGKSNIILDSIAKAFPINQYIADASQVYDKEDNKGILMDVLGIIDNIKSEKNESKGRVENIDTSSELPVDIISGGDFLEGDESNELETEDSHEVVGAVNGEFFTVEQLLDRQFLYNNFYILDPSTSVSNELFDANVLAKKDLSIEKDPNNPQILIYHTHSQETYINSREGVEEDTVVGVGALLAKILSEEYGFNVIHDKSTYDIMGDGLDRNLAYNYARNGISKILEENPTIEVVIDVHRDGVGGGRKRMANIDGVDTAQIMLFNGLSINSKGQTIEHLPNPNLQGNLAFSLQLQLKGRESFPGFMFKNYLKSLRYNLHFRERSILAEVGTQNNTIEEAKNAMHYLGALVNEVITK